MTYSEIKKNINGGQQFSRDFSHRTKGNAGRGNDGNNDDNRFRFKNSLVITPFYEMEFNATGGIKYLRNHDNTVFLVGDHIYARTNNIQKIPILIKREINKQSSQKRLIIEEKYNYEEKYDINQNIILYFDENRIDFNACFQKSRQKQGKDITDEFSMAFFLPDIYKPESGFISSAEGEIYNIKNNEKLLFSGSDEYITFIINKKEKTRYKNKMISFYNDDIENESKFNINFKVYLENKNLLP